MRVHYTDRFEVPLPPGHRFPMLKYRLLRERLLADRVVEIESLVVPPAATDGELIRVHRPDYVARVRQGTLSPAEVRRLGFPWSPGLVERSCRSVGGTLSACRAALADGVAVTLAGGTHHAYPDRGEGYCVFNDVAVAIRVLQAEGRIGPVLVIDLDVHQGNGTAAIFREDPSVVMLDLYAVGNYPFAKEDGRHAIPLPDGMPDDEYLPVLEAALRDVLPAARGDLVVYVAGADPYIDDQLGRLALSKEGLADRDRLVFDACRSAGLPVAVTMGGGYARQVADTVEIHATTVRLAPRVVAG